MTQLVQLQQALPVLKEAGFEVFAISNDSVERLAQFAKQHAVTFNLLSDEDSTVIRAFGILNRLVRPDEGKHMRWYGIPYPGTFITDSDGMVVDKDFHQHHARRLSGRALLHRVLGKLPHPNADAPANAGQSDELSLSVRLVDSTLRLEVISLLDCRLRIARGRHIYSPGAPEAFTPVSLNFLGKGVRFGEPKWPEAGNLTMKDLAMNVPVYKDEVEVLVPITATSALIRLGHGLEKPSVDISISCSYQSCDENTCGLPSEATVSLALPLEPLVEPEGIKSYVTRVDRQQVSPELS